MGRNAILITDYSLYQGQLCNKNINDLNDINSNTKDGGVINNDDEWNFWPIKFDSKEKYYYFMNYYIVSMLYKIVTTQYNITKVYLHHTQKFVEKIK